MKRQAAVLFQVRPVNCDTYVGMLTEKKHTHKLVRYVGMEKKKMFIGIQAVALACALSSVSVSSAFETDVDTITQILGNEPANITKEDVNFIVSAVDSIVNGVYNGGIKDSYTLKETNLMEYSNAGLGNFETEYEGNTNYRTTIDRYVTYVYADGTYSVELDVSCFGDKYRLRASIHERSEETYNKQVYIDGLSDLFEAQKRIVYYVAGDSGEGDLQEQEYNIYTGVTDPDNIGDDYNPNDYEPPMKADGYWEE